MSKNREFVKDLYSAVSRNIIRSLWWLRSLSHEAAMHITIRSNVDIHYITHMAQLLFSLVPVSRDCVVLRSSELVIVDTSTFFSRKIVFFSVFVANIFFSSSGMAYYSARY